MTKRARVRPAARWNAPDTLRIEEYASEYARRGGLTISEHKAGGAGLRIDWVTALGDVYADLRHVADKHEIARSDVERRGASHYRAERALKCGACPYVFAEEDIDQDGCCPNCGQTHHSRSGGLR